jgi:hypothetical protein
MTGERRERAERLVGVDPYIRWLMMVIPGMLRLVNVWSFDHALACMPSGARAVEIGCFAGLSTNVLVHLMARHGVASPLFCCDPWDMGPPGVAVSPDVRVTLAELGPFVRESFVRNTSLFSAERLPHALASSSDQFFAAWSAGETRMDVFGRSAQLGGPIGFAYIDGGHDYDTVRRDAENVDRWLLPEGFVLLDDTNMDGPARVAIELAASKDYEAVLQGPSGFLRKRPGR